MVDLLIIPDYLDVTRRDELIAEMKLVSGAPATVYGKAETGAVETGMRKVTRLDVSPETRGRLMQQLLERKGAIEEHFGMPLRECEEPQFLRYQDGDYFVAHQDGNTPLTFDETRHRRVSIVIFLNSQSEEPAPDTYGGGALVFHGSYHDPTRLPVVEDPGTLIAFRAEETHEVVPVTHGERYTIVSWYR